MKTLSLLLACILGASLLVSCGQKDISVTLDDKDMENEEVMDENKIDDMMDDEKMEDEAMMDDDMGEDESMDMEIDADAVVFEVSGTNFELSDKEITVKKGDTVTINFTSEDGFHDWVVDEFDAATQQVQAGDTTSVTFVADQAGTFEYYCSVGQHRANGMVGTLIVTE